MSKKTKKYTNSINTNNSINANKLINSNNKDDIDFLDLCIAENKLINTQQFDQQCEKTKSPLEINLEERKRNENKTKLRNAILMKREIRNMIKKEDIEEQQQIITDMFKHPKMSNHLLTAYCKAIEYNPAKQLPNPVEIFNNEEKYKIEYYQYILQIIKNLKEENKDSKQLNKILDNPYSYYMSQCLHIPINPFYKKK